jgi:hypothetical protein
MAGVLTARPHPPPVAANSGNALGRQKTCKSDPGDQKLHAGFQRAIFSVMGKRKSNHGNPFQLSGFL